MQHKPAALTISFIACACAMTLCQAAEIPTVSPQVQASAAAIHQDKAMQAILAELTSEAGLKWRFNTLVELARIASPSRFEMRRQKEITRRLVQEWGFDPKDIVTQADGHLPGAGVQTVDGKPVYNVCVRFAGTYGERPDSVKYKGQTPKVLLEGHIDTVNPAELPPEATPYEPVKLQLASEPIVKTRDELAALTQELSFDAQGHVIENEQYQLAYKRYSSLEQAQQAKGYRLYVPGYSDAMINTVAVFQVAKLMKQHRIKPVYDMWICGTAGEEGKGNLCGMKQLYGYSQEAGKANNSLNFVANFGADNTSAGAGTVNYLGSYRFEIKYTEPAGFKLGQKPRPSALMAMNRAVAAIADIKTPYDLDTKAERTTYTVGVARCDKPASPTARSQSCTLMVDMRSPTQAPLSAIRAQIEPQFKKALDAENAAYKVKPGSKQAVKMQLVWFGDRPAYQRKDYNDIAVQAWWEADRVIGVDGLKTIRTKASSLNDNVPAAAGVPTINTNVGTTAASGGGHTWYEWAVPGDGVAEGKRAYRLLTMGLIAAGLNPTTGARIEPAVGPMGSRTTEKLFK